MRFRIPGQGQTFSSDSAEPGGAEDEPRAGDGGSRRVGAGLRVRTLLAGQASTEGVGGRSGPGSEKASSARLCDTRAVHDWHTYEQATTDLSGLPPEERLNVLIDEWTTETSRLSDDEMRKLFVFIWPDGRDSVDDTSEVLLRMLQWMAPVRDSDTYLSGTLSIFRAAAGDNGIRWTLDEAAATTKAAGRDTNLFSAAVAAEDVLGHFTGDGGNEVLVAADDLGSLTRTRHAHGS
jgi:hypothetical protein